MIVSGALVDEGWWYWVRHGDEASADAIAETRIVAICDVDWHLKKKCKKA